MTSGALEPHVSARIMESRHGKHHATYVKGANTALEKLYDPRGTGDFTMLERNLAFNESGHVLHSMFWTNLSPDGGGQPTGELAAVLGETFGGCEDFRRQMTEAARPSKARVWAMASWEPPAGRMILQQVHDHQGDHGQGTIPLLVINGWEHAYYLPCCPSSGWALAGDRHPRHWSRCPGLGGPGHPGRHGRRRTTVTIPEARAGDLERARKDLMAAGARVDGVLDPSAPEVLVTGFGESSTEFACFWPGPDIATL